MKRVLLIGNGYLSGGLEQYLSSQGFSVSTSSRKKSKASITLDPLDRSSLSSLSKFDVLIHMSSPNAADSAKNPDDAIKFHEEGTRNLLEKAQEFGVKRFIYLSTFHVYGLSETLITESSPILNKHPYAVSHFKGESVVREFEKNNAIDTLVLRLSNIFGAPGSTAGDFLNLALNDICHQAITSGKIKLKGDGKDKRDFLTMSNFVRIIHHFLETKDHLNTTYNVGSGLTLNLNDMIEKLRKVLRGESTNDNFSVEFGSNVSMGQDFKFSIEKLISSGITPANDFENEFRLLRAYLKKELRA